MLSALRCVLVAAREDHVDMVAGKNESAGAGFRRNFGRDRAHAARQHGGHVAGALGLDQPGFVDRLAGREGAARRSSRRCLRWHSACRSCGSWLGPADAVGHICHFRSSGATAWPVPMSFWATRTSTVSSWATGAGAGGFSSDPPASRAARPPAAIATPSTTRRAAFITLHFRHDATAGTGRLWVDFITQRSIRG